MLLLYSTIVIVFAPVSDSTITRTYKRKPGSRKYVDYNSETLEACLRDIKNGVRTQRRASQYYNVPRSTIINKLKTFGLTVPLKKHGHPTVFSLEEEQAFEAHIDKLAEFRALIGLIHLENVTLC
jgi:hypothetical protein